MSLVEKIHQDMVGAMKQRSVDRLSTLRMVKAALKNKEIEQRTPVTDAQAVQVLTTLIKQRRDSIEQFTKGNRPGAGREGSSGDRGDRRVHAEGSWGGGPAPSWLPRPWRSCGLKGPRLDLKIWVR